MALVITDDKHYTEIAKAIRMRAKSEEHYTPEQMADGVFAACEAQYWEGMAEGYLAGYEAQHIIKTGTFTPTEDTNSISLDIPAGAKMIEVVPEETPSEATGTTRFPIHYLFASEAFQKNNAVFKNQGVTVQYYYGTRFYTSFYLFDTSNGFLVNCDPGLVFEAGMTYKWTAHYWAE